MSAATATLPADWSNILDEMQAHLDRAIASANERMERMPGAAFAPARTDAFAQWDEQMGRLRGYLESAEQIVQSVDEVLQKEENQLRHDLSSCATIRQKLDEGMGRAIG